MPAPRMVLPILVTAALVVGAATTVAATAPTLKVNPAHVQQGAIVAFTGSHWGRHKTVTLLLGKPGVAGANKIADVHTNSRGKFRYVLPVKKTAPAGQYVIKACRRNCRIKVSRSMEIVAAR
jgi:hypothetical protein